MTQPGGAAMNGSSAYRTSNAFRRTTEDRLKQLAKAGVAGYEELRRKFVFERFLALLFDPTPGSGVEQRWVLKGGTGLLMRLPEARYSRDIDLVRVQALDPDQAVAELRTLTAPRSGDHLTFAVDRRWTSAQGHQGIAVGVTASIGAKWAEFSIDLALESHAVATPERIRPATVVDIPGLAPAPEFVVYALTDQVADKVGAMYERHGDQGQWTSSRYRDLVDLALIVSGSELGAVPLRAALIAQPVHRPALAALPESLEAPGPDWVAGYLSVARIAPLPHELRTLDAALAHVGTCLNPLLDGSRTTGLWLPGTGWTDER